MAESGAIINLITKCIYSNYILNLTVNNNNLRIPKYITENRKLQKTTIKSSISLTITKNLHESKRVAR